MDLHLEPAAAVDGAAATEEAAGSAADSVEELHMD